VKFMFVQLHRHMIRTSSQQYPICWDRRAHFQRRPSVLVSLKKHVDDITLERSTSDYLLQKRQTVKVYRALENKNHKSDIARLNRTKTKKVSSDSCKTKCCRRLG